MATQEDKTKAATTYNAASDFYDEPTNHAGNVSVVLQSNVSV
jgi:hypothetical protein